MEDRREYGREIPAEPKQPKCDDLYEVFGISQGSEQKRIERGMTRALASTHPDKTGRREEYGMLEQKKEIMLNPGKRKKLENEKIGVWAHRHGTELMMKKGYEKEFPGKKELMQMMKE